MKNLPIGEQFAFPDNECQSGMTYRQWLIGQAISASCALELKCTGAGFPICTESIADGAIAIADAILDRLEEEAIAKQQEVEE